MAELTRLGDVVELVTGFPFKSAEFVGASQGVRLLRGDNIGHGTLRWDSAKHWPKENIADFEHYALHDGDTILAMDRPWISSGLKWAEVRETDLPCLLVQRVARLRAREPLEQRFLAYVISGKPFSNYVQGVQTGTAVPHISSDQIKEFSFVCPSREDQRAISALLGALDDKISVNERIAAISSELSRAYYRQAIASGTENIHVGDLFEFKYGKALREPDRRNGDVPVYGCTGQVGWHDTSLSSGSTVIVGRKGANAGWVSWSEKSCWIIDTAFYASLKHAEMSPEVAFLILENAGLPRLVGDSAVPGLNRETALQCEINVPEVDVRLALADTVRPLFKRATATEVESRTLATLRDTLLPQLMSGRLRVKDAEKIVEDAT
ncbi:restriction endonuclease subunit S [Streptomyces sp. 1-11]|uniref:restriction endonuclease subunit S n=1 Tax=Streptomyces sp. 1-11 TaxID=2590549 RepID=UPI00116EA31E|nr:restriction endonuclease subunit S [Streptomyces sp. 1-11]GEK03077.1 hypothetical protein TNCT1_53530 [Streptomyces sp. 1-11]